MVGFWGSVLRSTSEHEDIKRGLKVLGCLIIGAG